MMNEIFHDGMDSYHICKKCGKVVPNYVSSIRLVHPCDQDPTLDYTSDEAYRNSCYKRVYYL